MGQDASDVNEEKKEREKQYARVMSARMKTDEEEHEEKHVQGKEVEEMEKEEDDEQEHEEDEEQHERTSEEEEEQDERFQEAPSMRAGGSPNPKPRCTRQKRRGRGGDTGGPGRG